jgi:hypothetical protein
MGRDAVIGTLRRHEAELRALGVRGLSLFGSAARGEAGPASDIDLAAEFDLGGGLSLVEVVRIERRLAELLDGPVDLVSFPALRPAVRRRVEQEAIHAF